MDKRQFLEQIIDNIRSMEISNIVKKYIPIVKKGSNYHALCPFHNDKNLGSFVISPNKKIFKCFSCGVGGDVIKFVANINNINYVEAAFKIALEERIITHDEYEEYFGRRRYYKKEIRTIEKIYIKKNIEKFKSNKANINILDKVYTMFLEEIKLSNKHKKYLNTKRNLSDKIIEKRKYKSYPTPIALKKLILNLEKEKDNPLLKNFVNKNKRSDFSFIDTILSTIPGFYQKQIKDSWKWVFPYNKGILIPIRNADGKIQGLQIRRDKENENTGRYIWFSSAFAEYSDRFKYGTSSGSPLDVVYPEKKPNNVIFITEGKFKSEVIASKIKSTCISVQGVNNWRNINKEIKKIEENIRKKYPKFSFARIYIAFDSDMSYKYQVYEQLKKMSNYLEKTNLPVFYVHWANKHKGIDDLLLNSNCKTPKECGDLLSVYKKSYWDKIYDFQLKKILNKMGLEDPKKLKQEDLKNIYVKPEKISS